MLNRLVDRKREKLNQESENIRKLYGAILYYIDETGWIPEEVYGEFEDVKDRLESECWHLKKEIGEGQTFRTRTIVKLWQEGNEYHAITDIGSHYVF